VAIWLTVVAVLGAAGLAVVLAHALLPVELARHLGGIRSRAGELGLILGLGTVVMLMGLTDDRLTLGWRLRLGIQLAVATVLAVLGVRVTLFWPFTHPVLGSVVTILWVVGMTNAFNLLDNMDGLAAGVGLVAALLFVGAQVAVGSLFVPAVLLVLVGALAGFLVHNRHPARLFMGDAGSNFLGFMLGALTVAGTYFRAGAIGSPYSVLAPLLVMAVPLYDTTSVIVIRIREGRSPFLGDRRHFSHRLVQRGLTPAQAVRTIDLVTLAGGLGALLLHRLDAVGACVVVAQTLCLLGVVAILEMSAPRADRSETHHGQANSESVRPSEAQAEAGGGSAVRAG
jgi:UDP-GlcNAc:undecaprenyl-phosphate GlcNAc-1-phosphate transferase